MNALVSYLNKFASLRNALIVTAFLFLVVVPVNNAMTDTLYQLAHGVDKLDFHRTYDVALVSRLFDAYGERGRVIYAWDLLVDTFYPLAVAGAAMLFALTVVRKPMLQKFLVVVPLVFLTTDVIENAFLLLFLGTYPSLSPTLLGVSSFFTRVKLFTIYPTFYELVIFLPIAVIITVVSLAGNFWVAGKSAARNK